MKKAGIVFLLFLTLLYCFGLWGMYLLNGFVIKQHMCKAIADGLFQATEVVTIAVPWQQLSENEKSNWLEDEVTYNGKMYDVISRQHTGKNLLVKCLCDDDENKLAEKFMQAMVQQRQYPGKNAAGFQTLFSPFIFSFLTYHFSLKEMTGKKYIKSSTAFLTSCSFHVPTPPPWLVS